MAIISFKLAVLFYRDGQVKFTNICVDSELNYYQETFMPPNIYQHINEKDEVKEIPIYTRNFIRQGDIFGYTIYQEI